MKKISKSIVSIMMSCFVFVAIAQADVDQSLTGKPALDNDIRALQKEWALIKYSEKDEDKQEKRMAALARKAAKVTAAWPDYAEPKIWEAIIVSTQAGIQGGLGALNLVKHSKELLEQAEKINPGALNGSAYTSLGSLYYQVPGWPLGFGDSDKARAYLEQARALNPRGIDPNFFYGEFLIEEGEYAAAIKVLEQALNAPARPARPLADKGRRQEIQLAISRAKENLPDN